ncbi:MAG: hypothetical protein ACHQ01_01690 [Candidatus Limnocylindrales bacterium]
MAEYRGRRPAEGSATTLPTGPSRLKAPPWPFGTPSEAESALWRDLWRRPVAHLWRSQFIAPAVVARYVRVLVANPAAGSLAQMESGLGLTPAALARLHVSFAQPHPALSDEAAALVAAARAKLEVAL